MALFGQRFRGESVVSGTRFVTSFPSLESIDIADEKMSVYVNGKLVTGKTISVDNGVVMVDGKRLDADGGYQHLKIEIHGNVAGNVKTNTGDVHVTGDTSAVTTMSGDVDVGGNVNGSASTMSGNVTVHGKLRGDASSMSGKVSRRH